MRRRARTIARPIQSGIGLGETTLLHVDDLLIQHTADLVILDEAQQFPLGADKLPR